MKSIIGATLAAWLVAGASGKAHQHQRHHLHRKHGLSPVEKRGPDVTITSVVAGPTVVEYILDDKTLDVKQAEKGLSDGLYIVVGETTPTFVPPPPPPPPTTTSSSTKLAAQFYEQKTTSSSPIPTPTAEANSSSTSVPVASGIDAEFPSGKIPCSHFPSDYGAVPVEWLNTGGWTSLQQPDSYTPGQPISNIVAPTSGGCKPKMFCSYACPAGYQKSQFPQSQGATGQSVGGVYCNSDGFLELTRPSHPQLCQQGAGGVFIVNKLSGPASVCRTDYPGSESMVIPLETQPGGRYPLTNPASKDYYTWEGKPTTAQYYVNNMNVPVEQACTWTSSKFPSSAGNWAPSIIGAGQADTGVTFLSIFANLPTSTAKLNFNIEITGDVNSECSLKNGVYSGGGNGCTTAISKPGGVAYIVFSN
ncbi:hypothetical protein VTK73DRAFT_1221 [Phialemonium thermophilum]|uniref:Uncharacterized protein n=1 Tax=Phialemonium thermophilum TaxID=223376 RepID=A0ABR3Y478_9PEZI